MLLTTDQFERLSPEEKVEYVAEHGRAFWTPQAAMDAPGNQAADQSLVEKKSVIYLRKNGHYKSFRSLLDVAVGIAVLILTAVVISGFIQYGDNEPFPWMIVFISLWSSLWVLIARYAGNVIADIADKNLQK